MGINLILLFFVLILGLSCVPKSIVDQGFLETDADSLPKEIDVFPVLIAPNSGFHQKDNVLSFTLNFTQNFTLTGVPQLKLSIDQNERLADCSQTAPAELKCNYLLGSSGVDFSLDGIEVLTYLAKGSVLLTEEKTILIPQINSSLYPEIKTVMKNPLVWLDGNDSSTLFTNTSCTTAASGSDNIRCWVDKFNQRNFTQSGGATPSLVQNAINGKTSLYFLADRLDVTTPITVNNYTAFIVYNVTGWSALNYWIGSINDTTPGLGLGFGGSWTGEAGSGIFVIHRDNSNNSTLVTSTVEPTSWGIATYTNSQSFRNDLENSPYITQNTTPSSHFSSIGRREDNHGCCYHQGHIAEIMMYDSSLSSDERGRVWCYLSEKYSLNLTGCNG
jgi:hypothetical protein